MKIQLTVLCNATTYWVIAYSELNTSGPLRLNVSKRSTPLKKVAELVYLGKNNKQANDREAFRRKVCLLQIHDRNRSGKHRTIVNWAAYKGNWKDILFHVHIDTWNDSYCVCLLSCSNIQWSCTRSTATRPEVNAKNLLSNVDLLPHMFEGVLWNRNTLPLFLWAWNTFKRMRWNFNLHTGVQCSSKPSTAGWPTGA